jgi:ABC-type multidrug transport system permease subunit
MARFRLLVLNEFKLFRTAIPIHVVAIFQPVVMYVLMAVVLVQPTFDMQVDRPTTPEGWALVRAMEEVGSPIGEPYIHPVLVNWDGGPVTRQIVVVEERHERPTAVQVYGLIDSNLVKNFRNRLTAAALRLWNSELGSRAVTVEQHPWLPRDVPYNVYFGMALLPLSAYVAAAFIGAILMAQEFELQTILEYRLSPVAVGLILGARLTRLVLSALVAVAILLLAVGLVTGFWPSAIAPVLLILFPVALIAGCIGVLAGLFFRKSIPAFLVGLVSGFAGWVLGSGFGLAAGFGQAYQWVSRLTPFTHATELLFPYYYGASIGQPLLSAPFLATLSVALLALTAVVYRWRVTGEAQL